ncbi:MarR family transcriptional regulator [Ramlibacter terrae]|uniref:MarR family transcriptional regulator n=1 Tax=Ramlibacter terrae TaxID=2732511 RepID=A0ABX6P4R4_9BURK|nr:MarR family transcriptional regulator [Ramlibacter terrae]
MAGSDDTINHRGKPPPDDVLELVHQLMHEYRSLQYRQLRDGPHPITHMDARVLGYFSRHPGATQRELAAHSGRDKAQLARLIKGLREQGLLAAAVDPADRRNVQLSLTEAGQDVHKALQQQSRRTGAKAVAGMADVEKQQLVELLNRVRQNLRG